ncbi:hypothetical protein RvY_04221 [Ramazzottius varieornatus]|uniref:Cathepsin propeptide inhibitor domain-containing protein n=1 Tax=Ramazzottius varieornatus TaxID=947166 RepID=A0A1D1UWN4_RAMVA|nr:hypothetical protein RvY_04221 [Ramazzottius varieornatus]
MQSALLGSALFGLLAVSLAAVTLDGRRSPGAIADADPNTNVPRDWEAYKKFCKVTTDPKKDAAQKATFLKTVQMVRANQAQQASGKKLASDFVGMNLNCHAHMTPEEFKQGALGLKPAAPIRRPIMVGEAE